MKNTVTTFVVLLGLVSAFAATPAFAVDPTPGTYNSTDLGGAVELGRATQSWALALNAMQGAGDVYNAQSWSGAVLGAQWRFSCGVQPGVQTVQDFRVGGTGAVIYTNTFAGGTFFLSKNGPWGNSINDLTGTVGVTRNIVTVEYVGGAPVSARATVNSDGMFDGSNCALTFVLANGLGLGDTDSGPLPANFPALLDPNCQPTRTNGSWGSLSQITMRIDCPVPNKKSTWGSVKMLYR